MTSPERLGIGPPPHKPFGDPNERGSVTRPWRAEERGAEILESDACCSALSLPTHCSLSNTLLPSPSPLLSSTHRMDILQSTPTPMQRQQQGGHEHLQVDEGKRSSPPGTVPSFPSTVSCCRVLVLEGQTLLAREAQGIVTTRAGRLRPSLNGNQTPTHAPLPLTPKPNRDNQNSLFSPPHKHNTRF